MKKERKFHKWCRLYITLTKGSGWWMNESTGAHAHRHIFARTLTRGHAKTFCSHKPSSSMKWLESGTNGAHVCVRVWSVYNWKRWKDEDDDEQDECEEVLRKGKLGTLSKLTEIYQRFNNLIEYLRFAFFYMRKHPVPVLHSSFTSSLT